VFYWDLMENNRTSIKG